MPQNIAHFRFYEELNDFLPSPKRKTTFTYTFWGTPSIKDAIEAIGIPHVEVDLILINGESVDFKHPLQSGDRVAVYPVFESLDISPVIRLRAAPLRKSAFILDVQLGKLARLLRMLGFDTLYQNDYQDSEIARIASDEKRIILTRDKVLLKRSGITHGNWIRNTMPEKQLLETVNRFDLYSQIIPFRRCLLCNTLIVPIKKENILHRLQKKTADNFNTFYHCQNCDKIYWKGSHYERMEAKLNRLLENKNSSD